MVAVPAMIPALVLNVSGKLIVSLTRKGRTGGGGGGEKRSDELELIKLKPPFVVFGPFFLF